MRLSLALKGFHSIRGRSLDWKPTIHQTHRLPYLPHVSPANALHAGAPAARLPSWELQVESVCVIADELTANTLSNRGSPP